MDQDIPNLNKLMTGDDKRAKFFVILVLASAFLLAMLEAGVNYVVDPYGIYGFYQLVPRAREKRFVKAEVLKAAVPKPELLILGSSRVRSIDPAYASTLFGLPAYNFGVDGANPSDWYSATRYAVEGLQDPVRIIILGVDPGSFSESTNYVYNPAYVPELRRYLPYPLVAWARTLKNLWSPFQLQDSYRMLKEWRRNQRRHRVIAIKPDVRADGFITYIPHLRKSDMARNIRYFRFAASNNKEYVEYFKDFVEYAKAHKITLLILMTPDTPFYQEALSGTYYQTRRNDVLKLIHNAEGPGVFVCEIDNSKLDVKDFPDGNHSGLATGRLMVDSAHECFIKAGGI